MPTFVSADPLRPGRFALRFYADDNPSELVREQWVPTGEHVSGPGDGMLGSSAAEQVLERAIDGLPVRTAWIDSSAPVPSKQVTNPAPPSGNPDVDALAILGDRATKPMVCDHYFYTQDEASAKRLSVELAKFNWPTIRLEHSQYKGDWLVLVERKGVIVTAESLDADRNLFESLVAQIPGAEYDGWEAGGDK